MRLPRPVRIEMLEVLRTGRFDCLRIGQTKELILHNFPDPDEASPDDLAFWLRPSTNIWRYGNVELHFDRDVLVMVFSDYLATLEGGPSLDLDPWILRSDPEPTLREIVEGLNRERIDFTKSTRVLVDLVVVEVVTTSGVHLAFQPPQPGPGATCAPAGTLDHNALRLTSFDIR